VGYSRFQINKMSVVLRREALTAMLAEATRRKYEWESDHFHADAPREIQDVSELMGQFFEDYHEETETESGDLELEGEITWYAGAEFALDDFLAIIGRAATPGSRIVFEDYDYSFPPDGTYIYEILFDGAGGHLRRFLVSAGRPVRDT
jgi:hypothetical protein